MAKIPADITIRHATVDDVPQVHSLIATFASCSEMLPRTMSELYENLRDFYVAERNGEIVGCAALHVVWETLGEVKSVAVNVEEQRKGIGSALVKQLLDETASLGLDRAFTLTYRPGFFDKFGFYEISRDMLPRKIWSECIKCPKFPNCNETAMMWHADGSRPDPEAM